LLAAHWVSLGLHATQAGAPERQTGSLPVHVSTVDHAPFTQFWTRFPLHLVSVGAQTPPHAPIIVVMSVMHDWCAGQSVGIPKCPVLSQFSTAARPEHAVSPWLQIPVHWGTPPITVHWCFGQVVTWPHMPVASQF
jgi:hypothetical protein